MHARLLGRQEQLPRNLARNSIGRSFNKVRKRCNSNDLNSMFERVAGELRAKLSVDSAAMCARTGPEACGVKARPGCGEESPARPGRASRQRTSATWRHRCGGRRRDLPQCRWAVAGPGRASRRGAERSEALASRAAGPSGARNTSGATGNTAQGRGPTGPRP